MHLPLYNCSLSELDSNRESLLYWTRFYNQHYFSLGEKDRCNTYYLEHDILFDDYLEKKRFREEQEKKTGGKSASSMGEVINFG